MTPRPAVLCVALNPALDRTIRVPGFAPGLTCRAGSEETRAAGKAVNTAVALARAKVPVGLSGLFGADGLPLFQSLCSKEGISFQPVPVPGAVRECLKILNPADGTVTEINFPGRPPPAEALAGLQTAILSAPPPWVVLSGSLPPCVPPGFYAELISELRQRRVQVALDTSGEALRLGLNAGPALVKPNQAEISGYLGHPVKDIPDATAAAEALVARGVACAAVSLGPDGAVIASPDGSVWARPPSVAVQTTVGAGDAMLAGLIVARLREMPLAETARLATLFALRAITGAGEGLDRLAGQIQVSLL